MLKRHKTALLIGAAFGLLAPFIGMFVGLQISPVVANILMWPILGLAFLLGTPFGGWSGGMILFALAVSVAMWALVFVVVSSVRPR